MAASLEPLLAEGAHLEGEDVERPQHEQTLLDLALGVDLLHPGRVHDLVVAIAAQRLVHKLCTFIHTPHTVGAVNKSVSDFLK